MAWRDDARAALPPRHPKEGEGLRADILDEIGDHLECAFAAERRRGADEPEARRRALDRFGNPAALSRRLWMQAMKEEVMKDRILIGGMIVVCLAVLVLAGAMLYVMHGNQEMNRQIAETLAGLRETPASAPTPDDGKVNLAMHFKYGDWREGKPVDGAQVDVMSGQGVVLEEHKVNLTMRTDETGGVSAWRLPRGEYRIRVGKKIPGTGGSVMQSYSIKRTLLSDHEETIALPGDKLSTVSVRLALPDDIDPAGVFFEGELVVSDVSPGDLAFGRGAPTLLEFGHDGVLRADDTVVQAVPSGQYEVTAIHIYFDPARAQRSGIASASEARQALSKRVGSILAFDKTPDSNKSEYAPVQPRYQLRPGEVNEVLITLPAPILARLRFAHAWAEAFPSMDRSLPYRLARFVTTTRVRVYPLWQTHLLEPSGGRSPVRLITNQAGGRFALSNDRGAMNLHSLLPVKKDRLPGARYLMAFSFSANLVPLPAEGPYAEGLRFGMYRLRDTWPDDISPESKKVLEKWLFPPHDLEPVCTVELQPTSGWQSLDITPAIDSLQGSRLGLLMRPLPRKGELVAGEPDVKGNWSFEIWTGNGTPGRDFPFSWKSATDST